MNGSRPVDRRAHYHTKAPSAKGYANTSDTECAFSVIGTVPDEQESEVLVPLSTYLSRR